MDLSRQIAGHLSAVSFDDLPPDAVEITKRSLLDAIGVTLAASALGEGCRAFVDLARAAGRGTPESTILGFGDKVSAPLAALANGAMAHAIDYEDAYDGAPLHPNAAMVAAVLAEAQAIGGVSGRDLLTALAVGCDLTCRLGLSLRTDPASLGWYPPPILGAFGATAAVARLHRLNSGHMLDALSLTLCQATCPGEIKYSPASALRAVRDAFGAQAAVLSARLARDGVRGFDQPLEGKAGFFALYARGDYDQDILLRDLGTVFHGAFVSFKVWPSCRGTHAFVEAALDLLQAGGFALSDIETIALRSGPLQRMLMEPRDQKLAPQSPINAKFSLPFTVGLALSRRRVTLDDFGPESLADPAILSLARRVTYDEIPGWGMDRAASGELDLRLKDGRVLSRTVDPARGHPQNPVSRDELAAKFRDCAARAANPPSAAESDRLIAAVLALETAPDVGRALFPPSSQRLAERGDVA